MNPLQARGSTTSYGRRYLALMAFNLVISDEDKDGQPVNPTITDDEREQLEQILVSTKSDIEKFMVFLEAKGFNSLREITQKELPEITRIIKATAANKKKAGQA